jgi:hypothetical protein
MRHILRLVSASASVLAVLGAARPVAAQECVGLPGGRGILSLGVEESDGATGPGVSFAYQMPGASLQLQHRSLEALAQEDEISNSGVQAAVRLPRARLPLCLTVGAEWTRFEASERAGREWSETEPGVRINSYRILGGYQRLRVPLGISVGREFDAGGGVSLVPYLQGTWYWERERLTPSGGYMQERLGNGLGLNTGLAVAKDWFVVRADLAHTGTSYDRSPFWNRETNTPVLSLHFGVRF